MKKTVLLLLVFFGFAMPILLGCAGRCADESGFRDYRYNPFQFPYPEYYLKADRTTLHPKKVSGDLTAIEAFGLRFEVDRKFADSVTMRNQTVVAKKNNKISFIVMRSKERMMGCDAVVRELEKDYCSAFNSTKEFHEKLFSLTPDSLAQEKYRAAGNRWIVHRKGFILENVERLHIYDLEAFTVFRKDMKPARPPQPGRVAVELVIFGKQGPGDYFTMAFVEKDETLIMQILETLRCRQR